MANNLTAQEANRMLHDRVAALAADLPGIAYGYLGNFEAWGDDRDFKIFLPVGSNRAGTIDDMVSLGRFDQLPSALDNWDRHEAEARRKYKTCTRA